MFVVHFFENKKLLLVQLRNQVPAVGEDIKIKGRKGKVSDVNSVDEKNIQVQILIEKVINKNKLVVDPKKKRR
ncbi:hypothetical protein [Neobacillus sp. FSL H8-0543]|uniref:hypothetical protein n=1 Tax=Neobacillus sp. FSL H8-0543 TaxID=2954672 RepID=UPI0031586CAB